MAHFYGKVKGNANTVKRLGTKSSGIETTAVEDGVVRVGFVVYLPLILKDWQK